MMNALKALLQMLAQIVVFLLFVVLLGSIGGLARNTVTTVAKFSWLAAVVLGLIWLLGIFVLLFAVWYAMRPSAPKWLRNYMLVRKASGTNAGLAEQYPEAALSALMCVAVLTAIFVLTVVSDILASQGVLTYTVQGALEQPMSERLFRLYAWHAIDMIPLVDIWKTYNIEPPLQPSNFLAQSTVLVFRTALVGFAVSVIAQWVSFYRDQSGRGTSSRTIAPNASTAPVN